MVYSGWVSLGLRHCLSSLQAYNGDARMLAVTAMNYRSDIRECAIGSFVTGRVSPVLTFAVLSFTTHRSISLRSFARTAMRWKEGRESENVEDRRGVPAGVAIGGGIGTLIILLVATFLAPIPGKCSTCSRTTNNRPRPTRRAHLFRATPPKKSEKSSSP